MVIFGSISLGGVAILKKSSGVVIGDEILIIEFGEFSREFLLDVPLLLDIKVYYINIYII
jgi:hypothetical protein